MLKPASWLLCLSLFTAPVLNAQNLTDSIPRRTADTLSAPVIDLSDPLPDSVQQSIGIKKHSRPVYLPAVPQPVSFRSIALPVAMIGYGAFAVSNRDLKTVNLSIRQGLVLNRNNGQYREFPMDDFSLIAPAVAVYGLNMAGIRGRHNLVDRTLILGMSTLISTGVVNSVKRMTGVMRPDSSNRLSFPSGHTSKAFVAAEFLRREYQDVSPWYGVAGYAVAAGTGFLRMYNNKHWLNDVLAGAGVGILSTRLSYWLYPKLKNTFLRGRKSNTVVMPTYQDGALGFGLLHTF